MSERTTQTPLLPIRPRIRYHIPSRPAPTPWEMGKFEVERMDHCVNCGKCVEACIYGVHERKHEDIRRMAEPHHSLCRDCFRCVEQCPVGALRILPNIDYQSIGDDYVEPWMVLQMWQQAETGRVPVFGAGYRGPYGGSGWDSMWTDMSEIVRPTRDGIHGRETIATAVDLGRKLATLRFGANGEMQTEPPPLIQLPVPFILSVPHGAQVPKHALQALSIAAEALETYVLLPADMIDEFIMENESRWLAARLPAGYNPPRNGLSFYEIEYGEGWRKTFDRIHELSPGALVSLYFPLGRDALQIAQSAMDAGVDVLHVYSDRKGNVKNNGSSGFIRDALLELHRKLVDTGRREETTVLVSGGIVMAEHLPKAIICGADAVTLDEAPLIAMGHTPAGRWMLEDFEVEWGAQRIVNLMGAYRDQLLEILGAMGIRDVRRLRGETGRAMFQEDLDREFVDSVKNPLPLIPMAVEQASAPVARLDVAFAPQVKPIRIQPFYKREMSNVTVLRSDECINCGICVALCPFGVHVRPEGYKRVLTPLSDQCLGESCKDKDFYCINKCPVDALDMKPGPHKDTLGDMRWSSDLILSTWHMAETAEAPDNLNFKTGNSGGGFDRLEFAFEAARAKAPVAVDQSPAAIQQRAKETSTAISLNRRGDGPQINIPIPIYGGGMSFGSVGISTMLSRARAAKEWGTFFSTGEGGYPDEIKVYDDQVITQVATGLFGVKEDTIQRVRIIEFKYAQGAKPGLGGHLLADKNTAVVAAQREAVPGTSLFSPFPFHSVYSVEDHKKHVDWVRATNPDALISVKVSTPTDVDMVAIGSYYAGAHILQLDGGYGGTGAAPEIAKKNIAMPIEYAIPKVHRYLMAEGVRDKIVIMASGGIRTAYDIAKAIALGADGVVVGTSELVAIGCVRCGNCESGRGCPKGITTTDPELYPLIPDEWGGQRIINLYAAWHAQLCEILKTLGMTDIRQLVGRTDALRYIPPTWN